ncbi:MAG TPA: response regulator [Candidatus Limnocylindrales bacterium]
MIEESESAPSGLYPSPEPGAAAAGVPRQRLALVVDDEATVGVLVARMLDALGWHPIVTTAPEDAEALAREVDVDLLVTDFDMPGMTGIDLATSLRRQRASLPVVLVSGRAEAAAVRLDPPFAFAPKPFHIGSIRDALQRLEGIARRVEDGAPASAG